MTDALAPESLRRKQYRNASNLDARIALHTLCSVNPQGWGPWLFEQIQSLELAPDAEILELGCGPGTIWCDNALRIPPGWRVHLSDFSEGMIAAAQQRLAGGDREFHFEVFNAETIPHPDDRFDAVFANHMLYHLPDRPKAFGEIARVLRPGGILVASTLSQGSMKEMETLVRHATERSDFAFARSSAQFALENAQQQLAPFFGQIEKRHYEDALEITDPAPLLGYLGSMIMDEPLREDELAAIGERTRQEIERTGVFRVGKDSGVFLARQPRA